MRYADDNLNDLRTLLLSDFLFFIQYFFEIKYNRKFLLSNPPSNQSHIKTISDELKNVFDLKTKYLAINCPPGWSKSELCKAFICWAIAWYPHSRFLYVSYSHELASSHTHDIKKTISLPLFKKLFDVEIPRDQSAKDYFQTNHNGAIAAFGSAGAIVGRDAGLPGLDTFSGAIIIDDIHKPDEVHSDILRDKVKRNYLETIEPRLRSVNVPIIIIGQRLHEDDIFSYLQSGQDGNAWKHVVIKALDDSGNPRYPEVMPRDKLLQMQKYKPYVFSSQYQQEPIPAGGALFKTDDFPILENTPDILATFVTVDTAETENRFNDATVFSFWGFYQVKYNNLAVPDLYALHLLNCIEQWLEPKDLESEFLDFYSRTMAFKVKPQFVAIEKKSTGVTLLSTLKGVPGLKLIDIPRTAAEKSKSDRFIVMQQYIAKRLITLPKNAKHTDLFINHMIKITANNTHKRDDIADTTYDAIRFAFLDKSLVYKINNMHYDDRAKSMLLQNKRIEALKQKAYFGHRI